MIGTTKVYPLEPPDIQRTRRIKKISTILGTTLFILSLAFPAYIVKTIVTKQPTYTIIKPKVTKSVTQTIRIAQPSLALYSQLYSTYPETLQCLCSQSSINHNAFLQVQAEFHPICNSSFITDAWIYAILDTSPTILPNDFRKTASYSFQALRTLCQLSRQTFENKLMQFLSDEYVSTSLIPEQVFHVLMSARIDQFRSSTIDAFLLSFSMIRNIVQSNALFSSLQSNAMLHTQSNNIYSFPASYDNGCSCALSTNCISQSSIYDSSGVIMIRIPGFYTGCYVIDALLQSNLQCFYNITCLNLLQSYMPSLSTSSIPALFGLSPLTSYPQTSIKDMLSNLMIEQLLTTLFYSRYYEQCAPSFCTYLTQTTETVESIDLFENKTDIISMIGLVIGIIGGIIAILHSILLSLVKLIIDRN